MGASFIRVSLPLTQQPYTVITLDEKPLLIAGGAMSMDCQLRPDGPFLSQRHSQQHERYEQRCRQDRSQPHRGT